MVMVMDMLNVSANANVKVIEFGRYPNIWSETGEINDPGPKSWMIPGYGYRPYCF